MITFEKAFAAQIPAIRTLALKIWPETYKHILSQQQMEYMLEMMYSENSLGKQFETNEFYMVIENKEEIGFFSIEILNKNSGVCKLHKIYLLPSSQGKGYGSQMIDFIIKIAKEKGARVLQLNVNRHNSAYHFYLKKGFATVLETDVNIGEGYFMNDYIMEKILE